MDKNEKRKRLKERIESHLRRTARGLVKFDTLEETLTFLTESFWMEYTCDLVAIIIKNDNTLILKACKGGTENFMNSFPIMSNQCSPNLLEEGWTIEKTKEGIQCEFHRLLKSENITTWFTIPLKDENESLGFCIIGFNHFVPIIAEAEQIFVEFGKDVAVALTLAQNKEIYKNRMKGFEWLNENIFLGPSIEQLVRKVVERACKRTHAKDAYIYLYDEAKHCFFFQPPSFGLKVIPEIIRVDENYSLKEYFPYLEKLGENELTVPLIVNLKLVGVLHLANKVTGTFTYEDLETIRFLSAHISVLIENTLLYKSEIEMKQRLQTFMGYHKELVKQTLEDQDFNGLSQTLSTLLCRSILLFDRFLRPISYKLLPNEDLFDVMLHHIQQHKDEIKKIKRKGIWLDTPYEIEINLGIWPVIGGGDLLGYLAIQINKEEMDDILRLTIEQALNVYAIQFIKQKLVMDAKEQVKDSFINKLLVEKLEDQPKIIEYANLFNWNLFRSHRIGVFTIEMTEPINREADFLDREAQKSWAWDLVKDRLSILNQEIIFSRKGDEFILIVPESSETKNAKQFWEILYERIKKLIMSENPNSMIYLGIGGKTENLEDYYFCYKQAIQAHKVVSLRFSQERFALFEELGAYTLLHDLKDSFMAKLFIKKYLSPLLNYSDGKGADLFNTLRIYLHKNGNLKDTSEYLYIHRSTLNYRLEKVQDLLELDIDHAEHRLNLMLAFKLYDLYH
ncbi:MAG TPA: helix-turn-helix domain-containing protein [Bacillota bacterium]|nr:helix-turn-helix domain-containing protein [Bacillota bacterium]